MHVCVSPRARVGGGVAGFWVGGKVVGLAGSIWATKVRQKAVAQSGRHLMRLIKITNGGRFKKKIEEKRCDARKGIRFGGFTFRQANLLASKAFACIMKYAARLY